MATLYPMKFATLGRCFEDGSSVKLRVEEALDSSKTAIPSFQPQVGETWAGS